MRRGLATAALAGAALAAATCGGGSAEGPPATSGAVTTPAAPAPPRPAVRFAVKGDWGDGSVAQAAVTRRMCGEARRAPFAFVLTTGDNFYPAGEATKGTWGRPERCLRDLGVRWRAAWGNHDLGGNGTATALDSPRRWYAFAAGPARVVVLDGNAPDDPAQLRFLRREMARPGDAVRIVAMHQPLRTSGLHPPSETARRLWEPLLRRGRVALVLQGHNHMYERIEVGGITYVTTGGGGAQLYPCVRPAEGLRACAFRHHFLIVTARADRVALRAVDPAGGVIERVQVPVTRSTARPSR